ncbi:unnamed protein product [Linum tenue]|uniref:CCHC-type domain-containing protein n=1 Tax=Linum tenue TaxID=586396 RepID=A0AAV0S1T1_9ROSI|nr:unnamed protein product [Linum tenue]CAI0627083.1 unnamed protein product [Linum tenue]
MILEHYLVVQPWSKDFRLTEKLPPSITPWVSFPALPIQYYHNQILTVIGNLFGKTIRIDPNTLTVQRGKFARMAIEIDVSKPLRTRFWLDGHWQAVEYENLPQLCFTCGRIGHLEEACPTKQLLEITAAASSPPSTQNITQHHHEPKANYGPWMQVQRRNWRNTKPGKQSPAADNTHRVRTQANGGNTTTPNLNRQGNINIVRRGSNTHDNNNKQSFASGHDNGINMEEEQSINKGMGDLTKEEIAAKEKLKIAKLSASSLAAVEDKNRSKTLNAAQ